MNDVKQFQQDSKSFTILYVEDNTSLRLNAQKLLKKFFNIVLVAPDAEEALLIFKKNSVDIVLSDIKMPGMDGLDLAGHIKLLEPKTKLLIMSAFDDKEFLFRAIKVGVSDFLKKPVNMTELVGALSKVVNEIKTEKESELFHMHLKSIFNYQSSMVLMLKEREALLANTIFLDFFDVADIEAFKKRYKDLGTEFMEHDGFLYNNAELQWLDRVELNENRLFHVKMKNRDNRVRHLILKYQNIPEKDGYGILSFDDVTELNLLKLFDEKQTHDDMKVEDTQALFSLFEVIQRNSAKIDIHNYYKGLSITNKAVISNLAEDSITLKTSFLQLKAIQHDQMTVLVSEALPTNIVCKSVVSIGFEKQVVEFTDLHFADESPVKRKTIRVIPDENHKVSLFIRENKFHGEVVIEDISLDAVKLKLNALPAGLQEGDLVVLDMVFQLNKRPLIINTKAVMFRKSESKNNFSVVFMFEEFKKEPLAKYITQRQMALIREFKGLQNG